MNKLTSRKFWLSVASLLAGIGTSIAGISTENQTLATVGVICAVLSAAIYAGCEAYVDAAAVDSQIITLEDITEESEDE